MWCSLSCAAMSGGMSEGARKICGPLIFTKCSAKIAFKHDIAIEVGNRSEDKRRDKSLKGLENTLTLFFYLNQRPLKFGSRFAVHSRF